MMHPTSPRSGFDLITEAPDDAPTFAAWLAKLSARERRAIVATSDFVLSTVQLVVELHHDALAELQRAVGRERAGVLVVREVERRMAERRDLAAEARE